MLRAQDADDEVPEIKVHLKSEVLTIFVAILITSIAVVLIYQLWDLHPRVPILYSGDGLLTLNGLRNMRFGSWYWSTDKLGAPFGQDLHDFPAVADNLHLVILWIGVKLFRDEVLTFNLYFFGSYVLTTMGGYVGARMLRLNRPAAVLIGVTYSFLPYHYIQGPGHLYLAAYWAIPLWAAFLVRELMGDSICPQLPNSRSLGSLFEWCRTPQVLLISVISVLAASTGLYYAFFFLMLASFVLAIRRASQTLPFQWLPTAWALCVSLGILALQYLPIWLYQRSNGNNLSIVQRTVAAVEFYSLKLSNMVLPIAGHRISALAELRDRSNPAYIIGEGSDALGLLGSIGLIALIAIAIYRLTRNKGGLSTALSSFTVMAILICTVGGLAQVIAVLGFTQLRVWSRMSVVIAFPAIVYSVSLLSALLRNRKKAILITTFAAVGAISILDTNAGHQLPSYKATARVWEVDRNLVKQIEQRVGTNASVFQLPIVPFPENPPVVNMTDYDHLRGYLHSSTLNWSYGGVKGRVPISTEIDSNNFDSFLRKVHDQGFRAVWVNLKGTPDNGKLIREDFAGLQIFPFIMSNDIEVYEIPNFFRQ
jgi:phosphoglycerol transferase